MMKVTLYKPNLFEKLHFNRQDHATVEDDKVTLVYPKRQVKTYEYALKVFNDLVGKEWKYNNGGVIKLERNHQQETITYILYSKIYNEVKAEILTNLA